MKKLKLTLSFVNKGKPFEIPNWTPEKHEASLAKLAKAQKENKWDEKQANREYPYYVIHETLLEIDPECDFEKVRSLHPVNKIELYELIYNAGKENIYYQETSFRQGKTQKSKK